MIEIKGKTTILYKENKRAIELSFAIVDKDFVKPRFEKGDTQGRMQKQDNVIDNIINKFNPDLLFGFEGSFQGLPIITYDGRVVVGNHRSEALKRMNETQYKNFIDLFQKHYGWRFDNNQIAVRVLPKETSDDVIKEIAFVSNEGRETTLGEKVLTTTSKYAEYIKNLPTYIESDNVDELQCIVSKYLDKQSNGLEIFDTNLALFSHLAKVENETRGIMEAIDLIQKRDPMKAKKIKDALISNAGSFYNISQSSRIPKINIVQYITKAVFLIAKGKSKTQSCKLIGDDIESFLSLTTEAKNTSLALNNDFLNDIKAEVLGASILKFIEQENPAQALYLFLKDFIDTLENQIAPTLMSVGKALKDANIYDALRLFISQGRVNSEVSRLYDLLKDLEGFEASLNVTDTKYSMVGQKVEVRDRYNNLFEYANVDISFLQDKCKKDGIWKWLPKSEFKYAILKLEYDDLPSLKQFVKDRNISADFI